MNILEKGDKFAEGVLLVGCTPCFIIMILVIALFRSCMDYGEIDIDNSYMAQRQQYDRRTISDSLGNGFELLWHTTNCVTEARYREIKSRQHIEDSYKKLIAEAPAHFNHDFINTDIYDFAAYAKTFDVDSADVRLVNVFISGIEYQELYRRPNENFPDGIHFLDSHEDLGELYIKEYDIYPYNFDVPRTYRYWGCWATSLSDERHTHITDEDRRRTQNSFYDSYFREKEKK